MIGVRQLDAASNAEIRIASASTDLETLLQIQFAEENAVRGYVVTRDESTHPAVPDTDFDATADKMNAALRAQGLPSVVALVEDMRAAHHEWESRVGLPLIRNPAAARELSMQTSGKLLTDEIERDARGVRDDLQTARDGVEATLRRRINATVAASAGFVTLFAIVALAYAVSRAQAVTRLAREQALVDALQRTLRVEGRRLPRTQLGSAYASATRETLVGGDLLDVWRNGGEGGWFLIADASGKGIAAARHAAFAQYAIRALAAGCDDPGEVVTRFNRLFLDTFDDPSVFMVLFLGAFDALSGTVRYASAGHGTAYVRRGEAVEQLAPTGPIVGIDPDHAYGTAALTLDVDDLVLLATDGLSEARGSDGELLGEERVAGLLREGPLDAQALCDLLVASADAFSGGVQDDLAIVALRVVHEDAAVATAFDALSPGT